MARLAIPLFLYAETPLHAGTGAHLGAVDLPVQRERHTGYPIVQGSSLKGVLRALAGESGWAEPEVTAIFGSADATKAHEHAGAVTFTDARILLFPVRAIGTVFAWTTARDVLARLQRDLMDLELPPLPALPGLVDDALIPPDSGLLADQERKKGEGPIVLEEFSYQARAESSVKALGDRLARLLFTDSGAYEFWRGKLQTDLAVLPGEDFRDFTRTATEVVTRVKLKPETKTVDKDVGALWTEEHVPSESAFYALALAQRPRAPETHSTWTAEWVVERLRTFDGHHVQIGGDETTGRGFCLLRVGGGTDGQAR